MSQVTLLAVLFLSSLSTFAATSKPHYHLVKEVVVGGQGGWDYLSVDDHSHRLYLSQATRIVVIDLEKNQVIGEISDTPGVHGFALAPELNRGFSSNGKEAKVGVIDLTTLKTLAKVPTGENPDAIVYEPGQKEVYAFNGRGKSVTVIQAKSNTVVSTIPLAGKPEFAAVDPESHRVFVNIEDKSSVAVINSITHEVIATWPIAPGETATGMAIDLKHHHLFLGCENQLMVMMDSVSGKVLATAPIGKGVDANAFDPETGLVFSSNGEGTVTIAQETSPGSLTVAQTLQTQRGTRTMALDRETHRIYLPTAKFGSATQGAVGQGGHHPQVVPGTLKVLVYSP